MHRSTADSLLALATDVLAQSEARQRAARRLHQTAHDATQSIRQTGGLDATRMQKLRDHTSTIRELGDAERTLLDEFESTLSQLDR
jgi:hypothetical protein